MEQFRLDTNDDLSRDSLHVRSGNVLVAVRNPYHLEHLERILEKTDTSKIDIVALSIREVTAAGSGEHMLGADQIFSAAETELFTKGVSLAEKTGKHVELLAVPGAQPMTPFCRPRSGWNRRASSWAFRPSSGPSEQGRAVGQAGGLPGAAPALDARTREPRAAGVRLYLGPHPPRLGPKTLTGSPALAGIEPGWIGRQDPSPRRGGRSPTAPWSSSCTPQPSAAKFWTKSGKKSIANRRPMPRPGDIILMRTKGAVYFAHYPWTSSSQL
jgi:hypothetical protein